MKLIIIKRKTLLIVLLLIITILLISIVILKDSKNVFKYFDPIYKGNDKEKKVAFACNVVWGNEYLPDMLK